MTWSSNNDCATVDENGLVTNVNTSSSLKRTIITVTAGDFTAQCTVYCRGSGAAATQPPQTTQTPAATPAPSQSGSGSSSGADLPSGAKGHIANASDGLRVRSGPGTSYDVLASLVNGNSITVVSNAGNGWYEIQFSGPGGAASTGYILGEYIALD